MDKYESRRLALEMLVEKLGRGGQAQLAETIGVDPSYVSRMLYPEGKAGKKNIGEETLESISEHFPRWLDGAGEDADGMDNAVPAKQTTPPRIRAIHDYLAAHSEDLAVIELFERLIRLEERNAPKNSQLIKQNGDKSPVPVKWPGHTPERRKQNQHNRRNDQSKN